jgi:hypothetical protein
MRIKTWWGGVQPVLAVLPYTGKYPEFFDTVYRVKAPRTRRGWLEISVKRSDTKEPT